MRVCIPGLVNTNLLTNTIYCFVFPHIQAAIKGAVSIDASKTKADIRPNWLSLAAVGVGVALVGMLTIR